MPTDGSVNVHSFSVDSDSFAYVQALSPLGQHQIAFRPLRQVPRPTRRRAGFALATMSLLGLAFGGARSSAAADAQATLLGTTEIDQLRSAAGLPPTRSGSEPASQTAPSPDPATNPDPTAPSTDQTPSTAEWTLMLAGDSLLTRQIADGVNPFDRQKPSLRSADLAVINVETAISNAKDKEPKAYNFKSPARFAQLMNEAGVDVGSLANNHSMDFGDQGMVDTVDALTESGVTPVGAGINRAQALKPSVHSVKGVKVAVIGASQVIPHPSWTATDSSIGVATVGKNLADADTKALIATIQKAKESADVVIVFLHWGIERQVCPTELQRNTAKVLHQAGAAVVVGAHPHVLQPVVRTGKEVTAYSLGNFIWDPRSGITGDTGILELRFVGATVSEVVFHPHRLDGNGWAAPVSGGDKTRIEGQIERDCVGANGAGSLTK
jgi:hypothetical protein